MAIPNEALGLSTRPRCFIFHSTLADRIVSPSEVPGLAKAEGVRAVKSKTLVVQV